MQYISENKVLEYWKNKIEKTKKREEVIAIYIDNPFCLKFCSFCMYQPTLLKNQKINSIKDHYYEVLLLEHIHTFGDILKKLKVDAIYFGGGTSSIMSVSQMEKVFEALHSYFDFQNGVTEKTFELNLLSLDMDKLEVLKKWNFTNVTLGVQSFDTRILEKNNRVNLSVEKMKQVFKELKAGGIQINLDLMVFIYEGGISDIAILKKDIGIAMRELSPDRITIYPNTFNLLDDNLLLEGYSLKDSLRIVSTKIKALRKVLKDINHPDYYSDLPADTVTIDNHKKNSFFLKKSSYVPYIYNCTGWTHENKKWVKDQSILAFGGYAERQPYSYIGGELCYHNMIENGQVQYKLIYSV